MADPFEYHDESEPSINIVSNQVDFYRLAWILTRRIYSSK